ncbi:hypothetical protein LEMLEM_LOCUS24855 [Lemmus lemmus]
MLTAWSFPYVPVWTLKNKPHKEIFQAVLNWVDTLLTPNIHPKWESQGSLEDLLCHFQQALRVPTWIRSPGVRDVATEISAHGCCSVPVTSRASSKDDSKCCQKSADVGFSRMWDETLSPVSSYATALSQCSQFIGINFCDKRISKHVLSSGLHRKLQKMILEQYPTSLDCSHAWVLSSENNLVNFVLSSWIHSGP